MNRACLLAARSGNVPNQNLAQDPATGTDYVGAADDADVARFRLLATAFRNNAAFVSLNTVLHPDGLLNGTSQMGPADSDWPVPAW